MRKKNRGNGQDKKKIWIFVLTGVLTGVANGLFGGGGGLVVVPALTFLAKLPVKQAHATAIAVILPVSLVSAAVYLATGQFDMNAAIPCAIGVSAGGVAGAWLLKKISSPWISLTFAVVMLFAGVRMLF